MISTHYSELQSQRFNNMPPRTSSGLSRSFWALNGAQFLHALNDNVFRWIMTLALMSKLSSDVNKVTTPIYITGAIFAIPYILFSSVAGVVADRFSKKQLMVMANFLTTIVMAIGLLAFISNSAVFLYIILFLMITLSAFFSPCKLGIIPEIVRTDRISYANGIMEGFTYLAIILGTVIGSFVLVSLFGAPKGILHPSTAYMWRACLFCVGAAGFATVFSLMVRDTGVHGERDRKASLNIFKDIRRNLGIARQNRYLLLTIFAIAFFLFLGAFIQQNIIPYGIKVLNLSDATAPNLFLVLAIGIGTGSFLAGRISKRGVEIGLVPVGALLVSACLLSYLLPISNLFLIIINLFVLGLGGGFYIVPLDAFLQEEAPDKDRGELIGTANFFSFCGVALASGILFLFDQIHISPGTSFFLLGVATLVLTAYVVWLLPDFLIRFIGLLVARVSYRLSIVGNENIPLRGGALLVCNHVSYADAVLLMATQQRRIRFLMYRTIYENPMFNWLYRLMKEIPISNDDPPKEIVRSIRAARQAIDEGYLVCIFAEGSLTRTGYIMDFKRGFERIMKGSNAPIIPVNLHGVWGSVFSYSEGRLFGRIPRWFGGRKVTISFGEPTPSNTSAFQIRQKVMELGSTAYERERFHKKPLPIEFVRVARSNWFRPCMSDTTGKRLTFGNALIASLALSQALKPKLVGQNRVGLLMPTSVGGSLANIAVAFLDRVAVNLNYTASLPLVESAIRQCQIRTIITSRAFIGRLKTFEHLPGLIYIEDLIQEIDRKMKVLAALRAVLVPSRFIMRRKSERSGLWVDQTVTIVFSSGSTGDPKGVELTHFNIASNIDGARQVFRLIPDDRFCGVLPFFHSFGFTVLIWLPLLSGTSVAYHYNPLEAEKVGQTVRTNRCTLMVATPTFLLTYARRIAAEDFATLRIVIAGAEKMKNRIAAAFQEHFGIMPLEGYGATELSPVASVNLPDVEVEKDVFQAAHRAGSIGRPIPGVTMKVVDPQNLDRELGFDEEGLLLVKGPNIMKGYLNKPEKTAEVIHKGWYITGDVARIDEDGFVIITDRLSRFSKIGGEMVPHLAVEDKIQELLQTSDTVCAVTAVPDEKKGERLIVLLTPGAGDPHQVYQILKESDLPNLWIPSARDFVTVESLPLLGSGKIDLKGLKQMAQALVGNNKENA